MATLNEHDADKGRCFVTNRHIAPRDSARFTSEFDAWISDQGQRMIERWVSEEHGSSEQRMGDHL